MASVMVRQVPERGIAGSLDNKIVSRPAQSADGTDDACDDSRNILDPVRIHMPAKAGFLPGGCCLFQAAAYRRVAVYPGLSPTDKRLHHRLRRFKIAVCDPHGDHMIRINRIFF